MSRRAPIATALIVMRYEPAGAPEKPVLGLVGKGITFDTGGISIKPADGMEKMKYDMAGGATMIGAMRAIALLKPKVKIISIVLLPRICLPARHRSRATYRSRCPASPSKSSTPTLKVGWCWRTVFTTRGNSAAPTLSMPPRLPAR